VVSSKNRLFGQLLTEDKEYSLNMTAAISVIFDADIAMQPVHKAYENTALHKARKSYYIVFIGRRIAGRKHSGSGKLRPGNRMKMPAQH
jgi:hypothetical protein